MGAIFGVSGVLILVVIVALLWMTGATRRKRSNDSTAQPVNPSEQGGRTDGID